MKIAEFELTPSKPCIGFRDDNIHLDICQEFLQLDIPPLETHPLITSNRFQDTFNYIPFLCTPTATNKPPRVIAYFLAL